LSFRSGMGDQRTRFSAIHFQGWFIRQVSCYTLLSGFQLPWPPSCCQNEPTPFMVSGMSVHLGTATRRLAHPTSPVLLTRSGPLKTCPFVYIFIIFFFLFFFSFFSFFSIVLAVFPVHFFSVFLIFRHYYFFIFYL